MASVYLTIDDSPSAHTETLTDYLAANDISAMLFCRGDLLEHNPEPVIRAIEKGMVIANHSYSHRPAGSLAFEDVTAEIEKTEALIDEAYKKAGAGRPGKHFRFPYLDRGDGDRLEQRFGEIIENGALEENEKAQKLQAWLKAQGFTQPFSGVTHPLYQNPDVARAADCFFTYSSCDWMLTARHRGKWPYRSMDDLKRKMDEDPFFRTEEGPQIALFHDQTELEAITLALIRHMLEKKLHFLTYY